MVTKRGPTRRWSLNYKKIFGATNCKYGKLKSPIENRKCKKKTGAK